VDVADELNKKYTVDYVFKLESIERLINEMHMNMPVPDAKSSPSLQSMNYAKQILHNTYPMIFKVMGKSWSIDWHKIEIRKAVFDYIRMVDAVQSALNSQKEVQTQEQAA
jgi:hypothetical protein